MTEYTRPANGSRPIPEVLTIDPSTLVDEATVTSWARDLTKAGLNCHPEDSADTIIDGRSGEYLFTAIEADLYDALMDRVWTLGGFDPNGIWLHVSYEAEGIDVCLTCDLAYDAGPVGACCDKPILKPRRRGICRHCGDGITEGGFKAWTHDKGSGNRCYEYGPFGEPEEASAR